MKKLGLLIVAVIVSLYGYIENNPDFLQSFTTQSTTQSTTDSSALTRAFEKQQSDVQVKGTGIVVRNLADDTKGSQHQKFLLKIPSGQTILIAHNIDLAPRINALQKGDSVDFYGEYEWNTKGGVVHWTHHDPRGKHVGGWLKHNGTTYQ